MEDLKGDMAMLSKIVADMTALNNELNEKISGMNKDLEVLNADNFQLKAKSEQVDEIEANLVTQVDENGKLLT
jgi:small-conductance mechanosensitive channel